VRPSAPRKVLARWTTVVALLTLLGAPLAVAAPAGAAALGSTPAPAVTCFNKDNVSDAARGIGARHDGAELSRAQVAAVQEDLTHRLAKLRLGTGTRTLTRSSTTSTPALAARVVIPVWAHVLRGTHKGDRKLYPSGVRRTIKILNAGFGGGQSATNTRTRFHFVLHHIDFTRNDHWFHATPGTRFDYQEKKKLHRGVARSLNLYFVGSGRTQFGALLGWSRFPWNYAKTPQMDGVSVNVDALPGGKFRKYNLGDTVIHETGHWMGLFHTFQNGCNTPNDEVADTPAEAEPAEGCPYGENTCGVNRTTGLPEPGDKPDPIHNFMDYSYDACMFQFTPGQVARMDRAWAGYRLHAR
jgi:hypothetical protein